MLKSYASYFVSYLLNNLKDISSINRIILFGSVARGEGRKDSDIDIFIELKKETKQKKEKIEKILLEFYKSRDSLIFKTKGIDNKINLIIERLDDWKDLKKSIESTGIVLYGKYVSSDVKGKKYSVIFWDKIGKNRGAFLNKIYGFKVGEKRYEGMLEKFGGRKLGKSSIMIPVEYRDEVEVLLKKYKVDAKVVEVYY